MTDGDTSCSEQWAEMVGVTPVVTGVLARLDTDTGQLDYLLAGHHGARAARAR